MRAEPARRRFLTAEWRHLAILNFEIDPGLLRRRLPIGYELDDWEGKTLVSVVGFLFGKTRLLGVPIPFHQCFEEVNLRFYVRREMPSGWRRAVVFEKEIVPRRAVAWLARTIYGENYVAMPMGHRLERESRGANAPSAVSYWWTDHGRQSRLDLQVEGDARPLDKGSIEEFITEHYWGCSRCRDGHAIEYRVEHPRWRTWAAKDARLDCDVARLYGEPFVGALRSRPSSAFLAEGSSITLFQGAPLIRP